MHPPVAVAGRRDIWTVRVSLESLWKVDNFVGAPESFADFFKTVSFFL